MNRSRLVLMVEGQSEEASVPGLVTRLLQSVGGDDVLVVAHIMRVGELHRLVNRGSEAEWLRFLKSAAKTPDLGAVLLLLDGDTKAKHPLQTSAGTKEFCARTIAAFMAQRGRAETAAG